MTIDYSNLDQLMGVYADWIAWLREKERSLENQLVKMRGKPDVPETELNELPVKQPAGEETDRKPDVPAGNPESGIGEDEEDWL